MALIKKSAQAFRTISEVAGILDVPAHVLRFWESRFTQIKPTKRGGGRRYYRPADIDLVRGIRDLLYRDGLTIKDVQKILREQGVKHVTALGHQDIVDAAPEVVLEPRLVAKPRAAAARTTPPKPIGVTPTEPKVTKPKVTVAKPAVPKTPEKAAATLRVVPQPDGVQEQLQFDLFAHSSQQERRPFPPDPAVASQQAEIRDIIGKLQQLRKRMASAKL